MPIRPPPVPSVPCYSLSARWRLACISKRARSHGFFLGRLVRVAPMIAVPVCHAMPCKSVSTSTQAQPSGHASIKGMASTAPSQDLIRLPLWLFSLALARVPVPVLVQEIAGEMRMQSTTEGTSMAEPLFWMPVFPYPCNQPFGHLWDRGRRYMQTHSLCTPKTSHSPPSTPLCRYLTRFGPEAGTIRCRIPPCRY